MIHLQENSLIGSGTLRACYLHPDKEEFIVKVALADQAKGDDANQKELKSYQQLKQDNNKLKHISHCHGFVETDKGSGLICDCIRDFDGAVSKTIWDIVVHQDVCDLDYLLEVTGGFCDYLISNDMFLFDINLKNVALQKLEDNTYRPYAIDLKGPYDNKEFLKLSSRIKLLGRKKLKRRADQLLERIVLFREQRESLKQLEEKPESK